MKLVHVTTTVLLLLAASVAPAVATDAQSEAQQGELLVTVTHTDGSNVVSSVRSHLQTHGAIYEESTNDGATYFLASATSGVEELKAMDNVIVGKQARISLPRDTTTSDVQVAGDQSVPWGVQQINARAAADATNHKDVDIAVIDTGIDYDHPDLDEQVVWGVDTVGRGDPREGLVAANDVNGHGTHVAGIIAAADNEQGVVGVAPDADIYAVQALNSAGRGTYSDLIQGINRAVAGPDGKVGTEDDADVISMSLSGPTPSSALKDAVENAREQGVVVVAAAGNAGDDNAETNEVRYPAKYDATIAVGATDRNDRPVYISSEGKEVDVAAPGLQIRSTALGGGTAEKTGTSMATPHVAGVAGLLKASVDNPERVERRITSTARDVPPRGDDAFTGAGVLRADSAVGVTEGDYPPFVTFRSPEKGVVRGTVNVAVRAVDTEDQTAALDVSLKIDGTAKELYYNQTTGVYGTTIDTTALPEDETSVLNVTVEDTDGNVVSETRSITVDNERTKIVVQEATAPQSLTVGERGTVELLVQNRGNNDGVIRGTLYLSEQRQPVSIERSVPANDRIVIRQSVGYEKPGQYQMFFTGQNVENKNLGVVVVEERQKLFEEPLDSIGAVEPPKDPDKDGLYEDVNGDGKVDYADSLTLLRCECSLTEKQIDALSFNGDNELTRSDASIHAHAFTQRKRLPKDPDGDGLYEDVDGDGRLTVDDIVEADTIYDKQPAWLSDHGELLDFSDDGVEFTRTDLHALLDIVAEAT